MGFASRGGDAHLCAGPGAERSRRGATSVLCTGSCGPFPAPGAAAPARCPTLNLPKASQDGGEAVIITAIAPRDCFLVPYLPRDISSRDLITL